MNKIDSYQYLFNFVKAIMYRNLKGINFFGIPGGFSSYSSLDNYCRTLVKDIILFETCFRKSILDKKSTVQDWISIVFNYSKPYDRVFYSGFPYAYDEAARQFAYVTYNKLNISYCFDVKNSIIGPIVEGTELRVPQYLIDQFGLLVRCPDVHDCEKSLGDCVSDTDHIKGLINYIKLRIK